MSEFAAKVPRLLANLPSRRVLLLAAIPPIYLIALLLRYHLNAPYLDQWDLVPLLDKMYQGTLGLADVWAQHNEHRLVFPKLIMLGLARLTQWDIRWELATTFLLACGLYLILVRHMTVTAKSVGGTAWAWLCVMLSLMVFSMSQWQNWFLGWQLQELLNVLAATVGFILLARPPTPARFTAAVALGIIATFSFANGLAYWPIGLIVGAESVRPLLAGNPKSAPLCSPSKTRWGYIVLWVIVSCAVTILYFQGYKTPSHHPSPMLVLEHPLAYVKYVLVYLGSPIINYSVTGAAVAGAVGLVILVVTAIALTYPPRSPRMQGEATIAYLAMAAYAIAAAAVTGIGRVGFGDSQALSSRYVTMAQLLWVAVLVLAYVFVMRYAVTKSAARECGVLVLTVAFAGAVAVNGLYGTYRWNEHYAHKLPAQVELMSGNNPDLLQRLHPDPGLVLEQREVLRKYGLSIFRK